jgi:DNA-binding MarR family transcriptional regulator
VTSIDHVTLLYLVKQVELAVRAQLDRVVDEAGLTTAQYTALTVLERHPGMTSAVLARHSFVRAQTMAQLVGSLEQRGVIARQIDPASRRQHLISLTDEGRRVLDELRAPVAQIEKSMTSGLSRDRVAELRDSLISCRDALL